MARTPATAEPAPQPVRSAARNRLEGLRLVRRSRARVQAWADWPALLPAANLAQRARHHPAVDWSLSPPRFQFYKLHDQL
jgi:hypothetical protein